MLDLGRDRADSWISQALAGDLLYSREIQGVQDLVTVAGADIGGRSLKILVHANITAVLEARERDLLAAQTRPVHEQVNVFADELRNSVSEFPAGSFERLNRFDFRMMSLAP